MKKILFNYGCVVYCFFLYVGACFVLACVEIINLAGLLRRKEIK